ncbi:hypothetical protein Tbd_1813 [Thiobacillus denitrificans ATCC 25259]|uniref:Uncharacterized protein n=1 Tax=Thiobacillus denitrificans (strain ATCC 25259 / T1) TaxID=292415 RepID=Q3SHW7_THIDA|nr:hypothetical protein [Thiobacillus denitrificans]AAZ97766.1 hypothetical protein Tbd_1813 [Thiobacillus denitrificans ATCC 25259]
MSKEPPAAIDPVAWLESHDPGAGPLTALDCGQMLLDEYDGNGWIALHARPELAIEIMLAWLLHEAQSGDVARVAALIPRLAEFVDAADEARFDD